MARAWRGKSNKKKTKTTRTVKEGSPFEEELLVDYLNAVTVTKEERAEVANLIKVLAYFGEIDSSVKLHESTAALLKIA